MKSKILFLAFSFVLFSSLLLVSAEESDSETMKVRVNFLKPTVGISVPNLVIYGDIAPGYLSERRDLEIENSGNVDVRITPELDNYEGDIFTSLVFKNILDAPFTRIGDYFIDISRPSDVGGIRTEKIYMYLDLTSFSGNVSEEKLGHEANVTFFALSI